MEQFLSGQRAVITGGSRGIGFEIARAFVESGAEVLICGRSHDSLKAAHEALLAGHPEARVFRFVADVGNSDQVAALFAYADQQMGPLDILVNNAGGGTFRPAAELTVEEWDTMIGTNLSGAFYCSREALQRFRSKGKQSGAKWIVNISSLAAKNPFAGGSAYNASKFGLNGFSEALMLDHRHDDVRVTSIMPGSVDTAFNRGEPGEKSAWKIAPEDIAEIVLDILRKPHRTLISRVEVRPSRPPRK
jgi:3-oxoacyl-[acyl-carrier protein] reductase